MVRHRTPVKSVNSKVLISKGRSKDEEEHKKGRLHPSDAHLQLKTCQYSFTIPELISSEH